MSDHAKFIFDKVFVPGEPHPDDRAASLVDPADVPVYSQNQLDEMLLSARNEGAADAIALAKEDTSAFAAQTLEYIAQEMTRLGTFQDSVVQAIHREAVELAQIIAGKLARNLMSQQPETEVIDLIKELLGQFSDVGATPRITIYVHPVLLDIISAEIAKLTSAGAFNGEISVLEGQGFGPTDCSIEWADGGAKRDVKALEQEIKSAVDRYLAAIDAGAGQAISDIQPPESLEAEAPAPESLVAEIPAPEAPVAEAHPAPDEGPSVIDSIVAETQAQAGTEAGVETGVETGVEAPVQPDTPLAAPPPSAEEVNNGAT